jgi:hypothetical protein
MATINKTISVDWGISGLAATLTYEVVDLSGTSVIGPTAAQTLEVGSSGVYYADLTNWDSTWVGHVIWTDGTFTTAVAFNATDWGTATNLATVDTVVDAIKVKTDQLDFDGSGYVYANVQAMEDNVIDADVIAAGALDDALTYVLKATDLTNISSAVWSNASRTLTAGTAIVVPAQQFADRRIVRGDSYGSGSREFASTRQAGAEWPADLSTWSWSFTARKSAANEATGSSSVTGTVTVTTATGDSRALAIALPAATTAALAVGAYEYDVTGTSGSESWTVELGTLTVLADQTTA